MDSLPLHLPVVTIQPSFTNVIQEVHDGIIPSETLWVSCYKDSEPSVHAKVSVELDEADRDLVLTRTVEGDVEVSKDFQGAYYSVACRSLGIPPTRIATPLQEYRDGDRANPTKPHRICAFSVSPDASRIATGYMDGTVLLHPTSPPPTTPSVVPVPVPVPAQVVDVTQSRVICKPHLSGVTSLQFFPSSRVILSSGQDFSLCVIPADLPDGPTYETRVSAARVMRGHVGTVTRTAIIGVGRNVVSASLDTKVRLWDVGSGEAIATLFANGPVTAMSLGERTLVPPDGEEAVLPPVGDQREVLETSSKLVFCALKNGSFQLLDLGFKNSTYVSPRSSSSSSAPLTAIAYSPDSFLLATGSSAGVVTVYDTRSLASPLTSFARMKGEIEDIAFVSPEKGVVSLAIATSDGLPYVASVLPEGPGVWAELVGVDCDAVRHVVVGGYENRTDIWSASDDGVVRRYLF